MLAGEATTRALCFESAVFVPLEFVALTCASSVCPPSAATIVCAEVVAREIFVQLVPFAEQRSH